MKARELAFWLARFLAIYCLLCAIGASQSYFQSLAAIFNMEFVFGAIGSVRTGKTSPGVSWPHIMIAGIPVALYLIAAAVLWYRADEISEKMIEPFPDEVAGFIHTQTISASFIVGLVGLYVVLNCVPQFVYLVFAFYEANQTGIRGRVLASTGQIICSLMQIVAGGILIWRARGIARRLSANV